MLREEEIRDILKDFPNIKLSYETLLHKKVYDADMILAIPDGHKYFVWFTTYKKDNVCFLLQLGETNQPINKKHIVHVRICSQPFPNKLHYGTILYGTIFKYNNLSCFAIENVYSWQGNLLPCQTLFSKKLEYMRELLKSITTIFQKQKHLFFGIPLFVKGGTQFTKLLSDIETLPYKIKTLQFRYLGGDKSSQVFFMNYFKPGTSYKQTKPTPKNRNEMMFKVVPDIQNDIYHLYQLGYGDGTGTFEYYDIAFIPDYKTSVMMNSLFRKIKENTNLDALEESDDEEEFENENSDKFVDLNKSFLMKCVFNAKFKRWVPIHLVLPQLCSTSCTFKKMQQK